MCRFVFAWNVDELSRGGSTIRKTGEGRHPQRLGGATYYDDHFSLKTAWKWRKLDPEGGTATAITKSACG